jgi:hypothetical protein
MKESSGHAMQVIVPRTAMSFSVTSGGQHFRPVSVTSPMLDRYRDGYGGHSSDIYIYSKSEFVQCLLMMYHFFTN